MFKYIKKRRKSSKMLKQLSKNPPAATGAAKKEKPAPVPVKAKESLETNDKKPQKATEKSTTETPKLEPIEEKEPNEELVLKSRRKKGKKPKFKKIERKKPERKVGSVARVKNTFYPADVDFRYTSSRENWVSFFGQEEELDFGDSVRILPDQTDTRALRMI